MLDDDGHKMDLSNAASLVEYTEVAHIIPHSFMKVEHRHSLVV